MDADRLRRARRLPLLARILEIADQFLLLGVDRDHRLARAREVAAVALMCSNWALRSGCAVPSRRLLEGLQAVPQRVEHAPHRRRTHAPAVLTNAAVNFARLLHVQRSGDIGSPRVSGSTSISTAAATPGWVSSIPGRPAPLRGSASVTATPAANSRRPFAIVCRASPSPPRRARRRHTRSRSTPRPPTADAHAHLATGPSPRTWRRSSLRDPCRVCTWYRVSQNGTTGSDSQLVGYAAIWRPQRRATCERSRS